MSELTFEQVKEWNTRYTGSHHFSQYDFEKCLRMKQAVEESRDPKKPMPGDIIEYTDEYGQYYPRAHIEKQDGQVLEICQASYVPFMHILANGEVRMCTSGGPWTSCEKSALRYVGTSEKRFCDWGSVGACGDGAIETIAVVNVWRLNRRPKEWRKYTTKNYDIWQIYDRGEYNKTPGYDYRYTTGGHGAWRTTEELQQFLEKYKAIEEPTPNSWANTKKYWLYQKKEHSVFTKEQFDSIKGEQGKELFNGRMRPAKYITKGTTIHIYIDRTDEDGTIKFLKEIGKL